MRTTLAGLLAMLALAGCMHEPTMADFQAQCSAYGFPPGTPQTAECLQREVLAYHQRMGQAIASMAARRSPRTRG